MSMTQPDYEATYWEGLKKGELWVQRCESCGTCQHYPRILCRTCQSRDIQWIRSSGRGVVYSFSVVSRAPERFEADAPYVIGVVELIEGPRMATRIVDVAPDAVHIGMEVQVVFRVLEDDLVLPLFKPFGVGQES